jgi:hypothetical protein
MKSIFSRIFLTIVIAQTLFAIDVPKPPSGFDWQEIPELKAAFLRPKDWFFKREESKGTLAYFITKESIEKGGEFQTGLTIEVFHLKKDTASERGKYLIAQIAVKQHAEMWSRDYGPFKQFGCDYKDSESVVHNLTIANPKTNTLYLFIFESPIAEWESAWKLGKPIMDNLAIDDEI